VNVYVCVYVCVCVRVRTNEYEVCTMCTALTDDELCRIFVCVYVCVCVCVCVCAAHEVCISLACR